MPNAAAECNSIAKTIFMVGQPPADPSGSRLKSAGADATFQRLRPKTRALPAAPR
jgi:hypothetical protein